MELPKLKVGILIRLEFIPYFKKLYLKGFAPI